MKRVITLSLEEETIHKLDIYSEALGKSRSAFLEWLIMRYLNNDFVKEKTDKILELQKMLYEEMFTDK